MMSYSRYWAMKRLVVTLHTKEGHWNGTWKALQLLGEKYVSLRSYLSKTSEQKRSFVWDGDWKAKIIRCICSTLAIVEIITPGVQQFAPQSPCEKKGHWRQKCCQSSTRLKTSSKSRWIKRYFAFQTSCLVPLNQFRKACKCRPSGIKCR